VNEDKTVLNWVERRINRLPCVGPPYTCSSQGEVVVLSCYLMACGDYFSY
jgi:hypothetical protein